MDRRVVWLLSLASLAWLLAESMRTPVSDSSGNTWSLVAVDEATGEVGVAGASCFPRAVDAIGALVPGHGAATIQAAFSLENRNTVFELLKGRQRAEDIVDVMAQPTADRESALRQYGVVTLSDGDVSVAGFTGSANESWAGDRQAAGAAVSVQGNVLEGETVVANALQAFEGALQDGLPLSDRLMAGLEAGAEAGGDRRCNRGGERQTASAAFIMVARAEQAPFAVSELGSVEVGSPEAPWLYLSVSLPVGYENAVTALRAQYEQRMAGEAAAGPAQDSTNVTETTATMAWSPFIVIAAVLLSSSAVLFFWKRSRT